MPKSLALTKADLRDLLHSLGWTRLKQTSIGGDASVGFASPPPPPDQMGDMFCFGEEAYLTANYATSQGDNTVVSWNFSPHADICRYNHGFAPDIVPPFSGPHLLLVVPQGDTLSSGEMIPAQLGFAHGYSVTSAWWAHKPLKDEIDDFAAQMQKQGWQIAGQNALGQDAVWLHATYTDKTGLFHWRADVVVGLLGDHYVYGVLWAQRDK